jgi:cell wall-associated NlpC family hydrolase
MPQFFAPAPVLVVLTALLLAACAQPQPYRYRMVPGKTAVLRPDGNAIAPASAPDSVKAAISAANRIASLPYRRGGGHRIENDTAYDCSGATSYVLRNAGLLHDSMPASGFRRYGEKGEGRWVSIYAQRGHVFLVIAGLRFDTGWSESERRGPRWSTMTRPTDGTTIRHPRGL